MTELFFSGKCLLVRWVLCCMHFGIKWQITKFLYFAAKKFHLRRKFAVKIVYLHRKTILEHGNLHLATPGMAAFHVGLRSIGKAFGRGQDETGRIDWPHHNLGL